MWVLLLERHGRQQEWSEKAGGKRCFCNWVTHNLADKKAPVHSRWVTGIPWHQVAAPLLKISCEVTWKKHSAGETAFA